MTAIKTKLQAAIVTGAIAFLPTFAVADECPSSSGTSRGTQYEGLPDHAQAEARGGGETMRSQVETAATPPDHAQAEARGAPDVAAEKQMAPDCIPDHGTAEKGSTERR